MNYTKYRGGYEVFVQPARGETERMVLQAIAIASFEGAYGDHGIRPEISIEEIGKLVNSCIYLSDKRGDLVLRMMKVGERWCVTYVERVGKNHFQLRNAYQQYRGIPEPMLDRAKEILLQVLTAKVSAQSSHS